jgi:hypothetical protein
MDFINSPQARWHPHDRPKAAATGHCALKNMRKVKRLARSLCQHTVSGAKMHKT